MDYRFLARAWAWIAIASAALSILIRVQEGPPWAIGSIMLNAAIIVVCVWILVLER